MRENNYLSFAIAAFVLVTIMAVGALSQTSDFTYQGRLLDSSLAANGNYDFQFSLYDAQANGNLLQEKARPNVQVATGIFSVRLDFSAELFDGTSRFLEIAVKPVNDPGQYITLSPRQPITSAPYSTRSLRSGTADFALNSDQLGGIDSEGFIQNSTNPQSGTNFNISGNGIIGGTLSGGTVNATTEYSINGNAVLSVPGQNTFVGLRAGAITTSGLQNTFIGHLAGEFNTTGGGNTFVGDLAGNQSTTLCCNSFFGTGAGQNTNAGGGNAFFGYVAGNLNTSGGGNSFFGDSAGLSNTTGNFNSFYGRGAGGSNTTGVNNTFIGANTGIASTTGNGNTYVGAFVGQATTTAGFNTFVGFNAGLFTTSGGANVFLGSGAGSKNTIGRENTFLGYNAGLNNIGGPNPNDGNFNVFVGSSAGSSNTLGGNNSFLGFQAGTANTIGHDNTFIGNLAGSKTVGGPGLNNGDFNTFVGSLAGTSNATGFDNSFFGYNSGFANTSGEGNSYFGYEAGKSNTTNCCNSFFGYRAGQNTTAAGNSFFGGDAGVQNTTGTFNSIFGVFAGESNTTGTGNSFFGTDAGLLNTGGDNNSFFGKNAGQNSEGSNNSAFGSAAQTSTNINNGTAIGANAFVTQDNSLVLGSINGVNGALADTNVGVGTTAPKTRLHIVANSGNFLVGGAGCNPGYVALGFASTLTCSNYSILSNGVDTVINRPIGGSIYFMQNNSQEGGFTPGGDFYAINKIGIGTLGTAGSTALCRNALNQISTCSSSLRYKKDMQPFALGLSLIRQLQPITFRWKADNMSDLGFGAEDVAKVEPLLVTRNSSGEVEGVKYDRVSAVLVNAVKEQQAQIERQAALLEQQQQQINQLKRVVMSRGNVRRSSSRHGGVR